MHQNGNNGESLVRSEAQEGSISLEAGESFVVTPDIERIVHRAAAYLKAGYPVHFSGSAGMGKTTLALHVAALRGRPVMLMHGDNEFGSGDLIGGDYGYRKSKVVDNFIHSVLKTEESMDTLWADNRLTLACKHGDTLVYDEFTRSRPEANNVLLSILEEKLLTLPKRRPHGDGYLDVDPNFRAIFTSNPEEYAGVHRSQDALRDRMVTMDLDYFDYETEVAITRSKSKLSRPHAETIVNIVRGLRESGKCEFPPTIRGCIMIAKTLKVQGLTPSTSNGLFLRVCQDILASETSRVGAKTNQQRIKEIVKDMVERHSQQQSASGPKGDFNERITTNIRP